MRQSVVTTGEVDLEDIDQKLRRTVIDVTYINDQI